MASRKKKQSLKTRATKTAKNVGAKMATTGRNMGQTMAATGKKVGNAVGRGATTAKDKTVAAFGAMRQKIRGKDEEE